MYISNSNTFVNRNNYYNRNNVTNINRTNINRNEINRTNVNRSNINRNNVNRGGNFGGTPQFSSKYNQPQYRDQGRSGNAGMRTSELAANNQRNLGSRNQAAQPRMNQNDRQAVRGYGGQQNRAVSNNAMGNYSQGGNARANSARGQQSFNAPQAQTRRGGERNFSGGATRGGGGSAARERGRRR